MAKSVILGGVVGGLVILTFALGMLLVLNGFSLAMISSTRNIFINMLPVLLAPIAGGFSAGLIGRANPRQAGWIAGLFASLVVFFTWLAISGIAWESALSGLVISFMWVILSRIGAGFSAMREKS